MHFEGSGLGKFHISGVPTNDTNLSSIGAGADFTCLFRYALCLRLPQNIIVDTPMAKWSLLFKFSISWGSFL